jgi:hypothetical protein
LREFCQQRFACQPDAYRAAKRLSGKLTHHNLVDIQIIKLSTEPPKLTSESASELENFSYQVQANLERDQKIIETETRSAGRFVLATNLLDVEELSNDEMLFKYKEQQCFQSVHLLRVNQTKQISNLTDEPYQCAVSTRWDSTISCRCKLRFAHCTLDCCIVVFSDHVNHR